MFDLPLFPLNTVLFPGQPLPLHIFEERYKRMIRFCLESDQPFGVSLIRQGSEAHGPLAEPYMVGCTARIVDVQPLSEGRMNIITLGESRFRILSLNYEKPYLVGRVEFYPLASGNHAAESLAAKRLSPRIRDYMRIINQAGEVKLDPEDLPEDPVVLGYLSAVLLQVPAEQKQELLAAADCLDMLTQAEKAYRREIALMRNLVAYSKRRDLPLN